MGCSLQPFADYGSLVAGFLAQAQKGGLGPVALPLIVKQRKLEGHDLFEVHEVEQPLELTVRNRSSDHHRSRTSAALRGYSWLDGHDLLEVDEFKQPLDLRARRTDAY